MAKPRWIVPWADSEEKPAIYHCISRVVDKRFAFEGKDKEQFSTYMRMYENFSGCRVLSYCLMSNHIHLLVEVPPMPQSGLSDEQLIERLRAIYHETQVAVVVKELSEARKAVADGRARDGEAYVLKIHERFTYRMHDLSEFMKGLMQRFTQWYNRSHDRRGNLWEETFKSVVVEDGIASRTVAAYIDLNPVRAGIVEDPADYRWCSYGEAVGGGGGGNGKKARAGLVRAIMADKGRDAEASQWAGRVSRDYRMLLLQQAEERTRETINPQGKLETEVLRKGVKPAQAAGEMERLESGSNVALAQVLRWRVKYFTDGAAIGSRDFVDDLFLRCRNRFGTKRTSGARKLRGTAAAASGLLWSMRDLRKEI